jgi:hypothetical protein
MLLLKLERLRVAPPGSGVLCVQAEIAQNSSGPPFYFGAGFREVGF